MGILIRMTCCREVRRLVTPYVDAEASSADQAAVERHIRRCPACQRRVAAERTAREALKRHCRSRLVEGPGAPEALRAKLASLPRQTATGGRMWRQVVVAAVLALACGTALLAILTQSSTTVLAAQLAADHIKCFFTTADRGGLDPARVSEQLRVRYGLVVRVPAGSPAIGLRLVGARRCLSGEGRTAHLLYSWKGESVSLYMVPGDTRSAATVRVFGHDARVWSRHNRTYVLVSEASAANLGPVVAHMQRATW
jgi:anti-sigma factor (TIGR02949 family)